MEGCRARMTRTMLRKALPLSLLALVAALSAPGVGAAYEETDCVTTSTGYVACGTVTAMFGSVAAGEGEATGPVTWRLCLDTWYPTTTNCEESTGYAYAGAVEGPYWTTTCVHGRLYADGTLVAETMWMC